MFYELIKPEIKKVEEYISTVLEDEPEETYGMLLPYIMRGGKRIRPMLALLCCKAVGGDVQQVIKPAGIIEIFHNFTLIHDDLMDGSQFRRGAPTLHISHGTPIAINSGDALYTLVWKEMVSLDIEPGKLVDLQDMYVQTFKKVAEGQGTELEWEREKRFDISEEDYLSMINGKTASLIGLSCRIGAWMGGADPKTCNRMQRFGEQIGAAFQIHDDILNITGSFEKYQKEIGGDITEGKRTLMVVHCLRNCDNPTKERIMQVLSGHSKEKEDIGFVISSFEKYGSIKYAKDAAMKLIQQAEDELSKLKESEEKNALIAICDYIISRER